MKRKLSRWFGKVRQLESAIATRVEGATRTITSSSPTEPLEIVHAIVDLVAAEVQPAGRGRHVFPFTHVRILVAAASPRDKARLEVACEGPPTVGDRILERLGTAGCPASNVSVAVSMVTEAQPDWPRPEFHIEFTRDAPTVPVVAPQAPLELEVTHGTAEHATYTITGDATVTIGRGTEVRDSRQRLLQTNHVAFVEGADDVNQSVSRRHARIERDPATGICRLFDDGAAQGTSVVRGGRGLQVPRGRGLRLVSGDVVILGQARVRVRFGGEGSG